MNIGCIIQARLGSSRLLGKVLAEICGKPMIIHVVERVRRIPMIGRVVVATTDRPGDDQIESLCKMHKIDIFRGSEDDVLDRYYRCASHYSMDVVVRITSDCPLVDPAVAGDVVKRFLDDKYDYMSNAYPHPTYPDGLDVEVFSFGALETAWRTARLKSEREHVTAFIWKNEARRFSLGQARSPVDLSGMRWTVDTDADLKFVRAVYDGLYAANPDFNMDDILQLLKDNPRIADINRGIGRNEGYVKSLKSDREAAW